MRKHRRRPALKALRVVGRALRFAGNLGGNTEYELRPMFGAKLFLCASEDHGESYEKV